MATVLNVGLAQAARLLGGVSSALPFTVIEVGTGITAEAPDQTGLITPVAYVIVVPTYEANYKCVWIGTIEFSATHSLTEVGIRTTDGIGLMRHLWTLVRGVNPGDQIQVTLKATVGRPAT